MNYDKSVRYQEFLTRLGSAIPAASFEEGYDLICAILTAVENELTQIPEDSKNYLNDGRMYPPQMDNMSFDKTKPDVRRFRSKGHVTFIAENGAIQIKRVNGQLEFEKSGSNGKGVWE